MSVDNRQRAKEFVERWANRGAEKSDTHDFWIHLLEDVLGVKSTDLDIRFEKRTTAAGWIAQMLTMDTRLRSAVGGPS